MRGTLEVVLKAYLYLSNQHCSDEAQKAETVLSAAVCYIYIYIYIYYMASSASGQYAANSVF